jgi:hypothetical protein
MTKKKDQRMTYAGVSGAGDHVYIDLNGDVGVFMRPGTFDGLGQPNVITVAWEAQS